MQAIQPRLLIILVWKLDGNEILGQTFSYIVVYHMWLSSLEIHARSAENFQELKPEFLVKWKVQYNHLMVNILIVRLDWVCRFDLIVA